MDLTAPIGIAGAVVGVAAKSVADLLLERRAERRRVTEAVARAVEHEREQLEVLRRLLSDSKAIVAEQAKTRDRLMTELRANHPDFQPSRRGYEYWFSELYEGMTPQERTLHGMIVGYTEGQLMPANRELERWLARNAHFSEDRQNSDARTQLAFQLTLLTRHLRGWFVKHDEVFEPDRKRGLVYLADNDNLGPEFPAQLDTAVLVALAELAPSP